MLKTATNNRQSNRPFKTLPHSRLYFSPRSYQQITVNIQLTCQRIYYIPNVVQSGSRLGSYNQYRIRYMSRKQIKTGT